MSLQEETIALAALLQHCRQVDQLATQGRVDHQELADSLQQLFIFDFDSLADAFGDRPTLRPGLTVFANMLGRQDEARSNVILQYAVALLSLERRLARDPDMLRLIRSRLEHAAFSTSHFATDQHTVAANLAGIYQDTLSTLNYRIQVKGNMQHLQDEHTANCIRALLLSAVRAVRLWRLAGGKRRRLLIHRGAFADAAETMLKQS